MSMSCSDPTSVRTMSGRCPDIHLADSVNQHRGEPSAHKGDTGTRASPNCPWPSGWPDCALPRYGRRSWPRSRPRVGSWPCCWPACTSCSRWVIHRTTSPPPKPRWPRWRPGRAAPVMEVLYDLMLGREGRELLYLPILDYADGDLDAVREMLIHPATVLGLGDGGAHCGVLCDASLPTFMLTHWARDR